MLFRGSPFVSLVRSQALLPNYRAPGNEANLLFTVRSVLNRCMPVCPKRQLLLLTVPSNGREPAFNRANANPVPHACYPCVAIAGLRLLN